MSEEKQLARTLRSGPVFTRPSTKIPSRSKAKTVKKPNSLSDLRVDEQELNSINDNVERVQTQNTADSIPKLGTPEKSSPGRPSRILRSSCCCERPEPLGGGGVTLRQYSGNNIQC